MKSNADYEREIREANEIGDELGLKHLVISLSWKRKPKLDDLFAKGEVTFVSSYDGFWGEGIEYRKTVTNPTWRDMFLAADESIEVTGDHHHVFLEGLSYNQNDRSYSFSFGS